MGRADAVAADTGAAAEGERVLLCARDMARTRGRLVDLVAATGGVLLLLLALLLVDQRLREGVLGGGSGTPHLAGLTQDMSYLAMAGALMASQMFRSELLGQTHVLLFAITAVVLVVLLMRL